MVYRFNLENWHEIKSLASKTFRCWYCGAEIASNNGYGSLKKGGVYAGNMSVYICHSCKAPNIFDNFGYAVLNAPVGKNIDKLPENIDKVYNEARACISAGAYTAAVMLFRKILMNLSVEEGAKEGEAFTFYVDYLCKNGFVHKRQTRQASEIRKMGNDANHKIECRTQEEAFKMLKFIEFLLLNNYQFADDEENQNKT
jgi:hypothetical protein